MDLRKNFAESFPQDIQDRLCINHYMFFVDKHFIEIYNKKEKVTEFLIYCDYNNFITIKTWGNYDKVKPVMYHLTLNNDMTPCDEWHDISTTPVVTVKTKYKKNIKRMKEYCIKIFSNIEKMKKLSERKAFLEQL